MNRYFQLLFLFFSFSLLQAQNVSPWKRIPFKTALTTENTIAQKNLSNSLFFELDKSVLSQSLDSLQAPFSINELVIEIPNKKGELEQYQIHEFSNFEPDLQAQFPTIKSYVGKSLSNKEATLYFSFSPNGIQTMVLRQDQPTEFIEKVLGTQEVYELFDSNSVNPDKLPLYCTTIDKELNNLQEKITTTSSSLSGQFKTLRLALACTAEYTAYFGGLSQALAAMNATMTRVNAIFNRDLAVHLNLISNTTALIYTNPLTDPYSPAIVGANGAWNLELQRDLTTKIGSGNYDIGHLFGATGGGGNAGCIGCVCQNPSSLNDVAKGGGYSSPANGRPEGDTFDIDFVIHEMGHQLGANHTFSHEVEGTGVNVEPGGGSTIMAYAGVTDYNVQNNSDDYFAFVSIEQILHNLATKSCPVSSIISNATPIANAGEDFIIPKGTPFILKGSGSDPNGDIISYCWEQNDSAITSIGPNSIAYPTKVDGPLFRSFPPTTSPKRFLPELNKVVANVLNSPWESVTDVSRTLHFTLTVRDNALNGLAQTDTDAMQVTIDANKGPFEISSQNTNDLYWKPLSLQTINWTVNNTQELPGSVKVNIKLSIDGGLTFPIILKANTPNDGSELILVPNGIMGKNCRILIEPTNNIYYAMNKEPFAIGYVTETICTTYNFTAPFSIPESTVYTSKTIVVPDDASLVSDVNIALSLSHTYLSDVQVELVNPQGKTVQLFEKGCGDTSGTLAINFDDLGGLIACDKPTLQTVAPFSSLSAFNDSNPAGSWSLRVRDEFAGDSGTVNSAAVTICSKKFTPIAPTNYDLTEVLVYPNPTDGDFGVLFSSKLNSGVTIIIHDVLGKKIYEKEFPSAPLFNETIQLNSIQAGIYFVTIRDGDHVTYKKLLKY